MKAFPFIASLLINWCLQIRIVGCHLHERMKYTCRNQNKEICRQHDHSCTTKHAYKYTEKMTRKILLAYKQ